MNRRGPRTAGIYFSHYECFGHVSRAIAVGEVFKERFPEGSLFFIQTGVPQSQSQIDRLGRVYPLPARVMDRRNFRASGRSVGPDVAARSKACANILSREKPDLFITEFFPLGREECRYELIPSLAALAAQGVAVWGVAGYPLLTGEDQGWREKVLRLYQRIIIFSPAREKDLIAARFARAGDRRRYLDFFEKNASKITFAGYLLPRQEVVCDDGDENHHRPPVPKGACRVAVVRGGGAVYPKLIAEAIRASDSLGKEFHMTVIAGPSTTSREWYLFATLAGKKKVNNLVLRRAADDYEKVLAESDLCVSMASYHTSVMLLKHRKRAVVIPFEGYEGEMTFREQPARAAMLKEMLGTTVLSIEDLTAAGLAAAIKETANRRAILPKVPEDWFGGRDVLGGSLTGLSGR